MRMKQQPSITLNDKESFIFNNPYKIKNNNATQQT